MTETKRLRQAAHCLSPAIGRLLAPHIPLLEHTVQEIRLRAARPVALVGAQGVWYLTQSGGLTDLPCGDLFRAQPGDLEATFHTRSTPDSMSCKTALSRCAAVTAWASAARRSCRAAAC